MRVLWFSNRPPVGVQLSKKTVGGSWIESLEDELMTNSNLHIELGIVYSQLAKESTEIRSENFSTRYFMVPRDPYGKMRRWVSRFFAGPLSERPLQKYLAIVDDFKPDVILFFGTESDFPLIIPQLKIPSIIWFQGNLNIYQRMFESGIQLRKTLRYETLKDMLMGDTLIHNYLLFKRKVTREKRIFSIAENFIGRTTWDRRVVSVMSPQANYYHCDETMRQIFWEKQWIQWQNRDKFIITTTIRGNLYKGLETVFEACDLLADRLEQQLEWRIIGIAKDTVYVKAARKKANFPRSRTTVKLLGSKSGPELVQELLNADIYVHPSHIENSPNGVQEAMLLGMPVIATNVGGTPSMLTDGMEGLLVQNKDPFALAGAILELYRFPNNAKMMGKNARKLGLLRNDNNKICSDLLDIFDQLAGSSKKKSTG